MSVEGLHRVWHNWTLDSHFITFFLLLFLLYTEESRQNWDGQEAVVAEQVGDGGTWTQAEMAEVGLARGHIYL